MAMEVIEVYDSRGDPRWPLSQLRKISVKFMRSLSASYKDMDKLDRMSLVSLMLYEALLRQYRAVQHNERRQRKFEHVLELMRHHEMFEGASLAALLLTTCTSPMTIAALDEGYESQLSFRHLCKHGSFEAKMEAMTFINPNYEEVRDGLTEMQTVFNQAEEASMRQFNARVVTASVGSGQYNARVRSRTPPR